MPTGPRRGRPGRSDRSGAPELRRSTLGGDGRVVPVGHSIFVPRDESNRAVLRDDDGERLVKSCTQAIGGAVPRPDAVDALELPARALEVERALNRVDLGQVAGDLAAEAENFESFGQD